ncbi:hypothetical protein D3C71_299400 [compost metagenome]
MGPDEVEGVMPYRLDVAGGQRVHLLLDDDAGKQRHQHRGGPVPPGLLHDVQEAVVIQRHLLLEAGYAAGDVALAALAARGDHGGVAEMAVHLQFGPVVRAPQAEGHEPGMQQAGVVGVLDVLLHQLPVAGDALPAVAVDHQFAAVEHAIEVMQDVRAQVVFQRFDGMVERREHHAVAAGHRQFGQPVLFRLEVWRHAAVDLAVLFDAAAEGHADQVALQVVVPLVVGADEFAAVAGAFAAELHAAVGAHVFHHAHLAVVIAQQDDGAFAHGGALEVARIGDLGLKAHIAPMRLIEKALQFALVQRGIGIDAKGNAVGAVALPGRDDMNGLFGRVHGRPSLQGVPRRCVQVRMVCLHFPSGRAAAGQSLARHGRRRLPDHPARSKINK